jgi:hypothetical protein
MSYIQSNMVNLSDTTSSSHYDNETENKRKCLHDCHVIVHSTRNYKSIIFVQDLLPHITSRPYIKQASGAATSKVLTPTILLLGARIVHLA